jgi:hypothetical protein
MGSIHKQCKDLHDMVQPGIGSAPISQWSDQSLRDDCTNLSGSSADTMRSRTISRGENFAGNNKGRGIGTEVLEKIAETVKRKQSIGGNLVETKSDDSEKQRKYGKTADLNRFATNGIDCCDRDPIAGDETGG